MSGRLLRKVLQEQEELHRNSAEAERELNDDGDSESPDSNPAPSRNPFDLLNDDDQVDEVEENDGVPGGDVYEEEPPVTKSFSEPSSSSNRKSKKKKKKKTKENPTSSKDKAGKSIDEDLEYLNIGSDSSSQNSSFSNAKFQDEKMNQGTSTILVVDTKFLRPENELRRIFGSEVVRSFEVGHNSGTSRRGRRGMQNPRKTVLVSPSDHWPRWDGSLSMELLETKNGQNYFKYVHTSYYSQAQRQFEAAKAINDLNGIANILPYYPYHIESLITIAEVYKFQGELDKSADFIAKCLFALECSWHPQFTPFQGNCQLKYSHDTNKPLFTVLFTHMQNMDRRGCHRSALEVCKLLLSLDSDDPVGAMFCIDYFSLRAEEYLWLERFSDEYRSDNSLWLFPNFSYSLAICRFYLERDTCSQNALVESEKATSSDLMKQALMLHPLVLKKIVEKAPLKDAAWTKLLQHPFFRSAHAGGPSLEHLINIYVEKGYIMWRLPDLQKLLRDAAELVIKTLDRDGSDAKDWACVRKEAFSSDKNEYSHLLVSDFSGSVPTMPPEDLRNLMVDPHMAQPMQNGDPGINPDVAARVPRDVLNRNTLMVLLESLLPWNDFGAVHEDDQIHGQDQGNED